MIPFLVFMVSPLLAAVDRTGGVARRYAQGATRTQSGPVTQLGGVGPGGAIRRGESGQRIQHLTDAVPLGVEVVAPGVVRHVEDAVGDHPTVGEAGRAAALDHPRSARVAA